MSIIEIDLVKKNSPKNRELLDFLYDNIDNINRRGYVVSFRYVKDKGKYPSLKLATSTSVIRENGVTQIKNVIERLISGGGEEGFIGGDSSGGGGGSDIRDQMMNIMGTKDRDHDDDEDECLTNEKIRARSEMINSMRGNRWDSKNEVPIKDHMSDGGGMSHRGIASDMPSKKKGKSRGNDRPINTKNVTPSDDVFGELLMSKIG
jgi:hypothetical protein